MAEQDTPAQIIERLEGAVDDILPLYDLAEQVQSYETLHGERVLNEDQRRRNMVAFQTTGGQSAAILQGCSMYGLAAMYLYSRRGASSWRDLSALRRCLPTTANVFLLGSSVGMMVLMAKQAGEMRDTSKNMTLQTRISQNEQTHSLLRAMKFHLNTRNMTALDVTART